MWYHFLIAEKDAARAFQAVEGCPLPERLVGQNIEFSDHSDVLIMAMRKAGIAATLAKEGIPFMFNCGDEGESNG